jgi:hypothetical protein
MGPTLTSPSIYKMKVGKAKGKAPSPKPVSIKTIEPTVPYAPFEPKWKEPKIDIIRAPEPTVPTTPQPITQPNKLLAPPKQPKLLAAPSPEQKPVEPPKMTVVPPPETLPDATPNIVKDYNNTNYVYLNTTKQYETEKNARNQTIIEKNQFQTINPEISAKLSKYVETRTKRLEAWRNKLKNEVTSLIEDMPMNRIVIFSSANKRTNVFIRKAIKLGSVHYGIIDVGSETRWVDKSVFYGITPSVQKDPLRREPAPLRYYIPPENPKFKHEKIHEIDKLIDRMIGITDKPSIGIFASDKALVKYSFVDKAMFGFKDEESFTRTWDPSKGGKPLEEVKEVIRERIAEKLLLEFVCYSVEE